MSSVIDMSRAADGADVEEACENFARELVKTVKKANRCWWDAWFDRVALCAIFAVMMAIYAKAPELSGAFVPHVGGVGATIFGIIGVFAIFAFMGRRQDRVQKREEKRIQDFLSQNPHVWGIVRTKRPDLKERVDRFLGRVPTG